MMGRLYPFQSNRVELVLSLLIGLAFSAIVLAIKPTAIGNLFLPAILMPAIMLEMHYRDRLKDIIRVISDGVVVAILLLFCIRIIHAFAALILTPPVWDFQVFWVSGSVAAQRLDFYQAYNFHNVANTLNIDFGSDFSKEILDVGFWYPPMTMFLFIPLGWFDIKMASFVWTFSLCITLIADIFLLWKLFLNNMDMAGLVFASLLTLMFPPIINNIWFAQTNFLVLLILLLFWRDREFARAGIWLALGIIVKPFMAFLFLIFLFKHQWRACAYTIFTLAVISLLSLVVFGFSTFRSFLLNPVAKVPSLFFFELGSDYKNGLK